MSGFEDLRELLDARPKDPPGLLAAVANEPAVEFWQVKRGGGRRGIVEVTHGETS